MRTITLEHICKIKEMHIVEQNIIESSLYATEFGTLQRVIEQKVRK